MELIDPILRRAFYESFQNPITPDRFGDILFIGHSEFKASGIPSLAIQAAQALTHGIVPSRFSHVAICLRPGLWMDARPGSGVSVLETFEIWNKMKRRHPYHIKIFRPKIEVDVLFKMMCSSRVAFEAYRNPYNFLILLDKKNILKKEFYQERYFCSQFAISVLNEAGLFSDLKPRKTLPAGLYSACVNAGWDSVESKKWNLILNDESVLKYISIQGANDEETLNLRGTYLESHRGTLTYSVLMNLHFLHKTNMVLKAHLDSYSATKVAHFMTDKYRSTLLEKNADVLAAPPPKEVD